MTDKTMKWTPNMGFLPPPFIQEGKTICNYECQWEDHQARIKQLELEVLEWQKLGNAATQAMSDAVDDLRRATNLATEKHEQVQLYSALCEQQNETMQKMSAQIDELAELAGVAVKPTRQ
jgi:endonuclease III